MRKIIYIAILISFLCLISIVFSLHSNINIVSPENKTYNTSAIWMNWTSGIQNITWCAYSLDGETNDTTICYQNKLKNLTYDSKGSHIISIKIPKYAKITKSYITISGFLKGNMDRYYDYNCSEDSDVNNIHPDTNYNFAPYLLVKYEQIPEGGYKHSIAYLKCQTNFDDNFYKARLYLKHIYGFGYIELWNTSDSWSESTITWNNAPPKQSYFDTKYVNYLQYGSTWFYYDVSNFVYQQLNIDNITSYVFDAGEEYTNIQINSTETITKPYIRIYIKTYPENITIDTGNDGILDYINTTEFNTSEIIDLNKTAIQNYLSTCTPDSNGYCDVPINISSDSAGTLETNIYINYTANITLTGLSDGTHKLTLYVQNSTNSNSSTVYFTVDTTYPTWSNNQSSTPTHYSPTTKSEFNITWTETNPDTIFIEGNWSGSPENYTMTNLGNGVYTYNTTLPAGTFYWMSCANDTAGNLNCSDKWVFTIQKASTETTLLINGSDSDVSYYGGSIINFTAYTNATGIANITLYINGTLSGNNITRVENISSTTGWSLGDYNITAYTLENQNYSGSSITHTLTLVQPESPTYSNIKPTEAQTYYYDNQFQLNITWSWESYPLDVVILEFNGTNYTVTDNVSIGTNSSEFYHTVYNLSAGSYNYKWYANNTLGYMSVTPLQTLTINKANPEAGMSLVASPSWSVLEGTSIVISGTETNLGDDDCNYTLKKDGSLVDNPYEATLSVGTYQFTYSTDGCENYTSGTTLHFLTVSAPAPTGGGGGSTVIRETLKTPTAITFNVYKGKCESQNITFIWSGKTPNTLRFGIPDDLEKYLVTPKPEDKFLIKTGVNGINFTVCLPSKEKLKNKMDYFITAIFKTERIKIPVTIYVLEEEKKYIPTPPNIYIIIGVIIAIIIASYLLIPTE